LARLDADLEASKKAVSLLQVDVTEDIKRREQLATKLAETNRSLENLTASVDAQEKKLKAEHDDREKQIADLKKLIDKPQTSEQGESNDLALKGVWRVSEDLKGGDQEKHPLAGATLEFRSENRLIVRVGDKVARGTYKFQEGKIQVEQPKVQEVERSWLLIEFRDDSSKGLRLAKETKCLYDLQQDSLSLCLGTDGKLPDNMMVLGKKNVILLVLKRQPKE
jgi:hypothetical protein